MSRRGWVLVALTLAYAAIVASGGAYAATLAAYQAANPTLPGSSLLEGMAVFTLAYAALAGAAMLPAWWLMPLYMKWWNARWDENGRSWALVEAEQAGREAGEQR